ncbi:MAG: acylphosphatase [Planctomycetia bacterium]|nr:acylphosphatase [Planctomycetia bacterium]
MPMTRAHVYIRGRVQGVFFRTSTRDKARSLDVNGWVKNCLDGSVEAVCEGEKDAIDAIVQWCSEGPPGAFVEDVDVCLEEYSGYFEEFSVVY